MFYFLGGILLWYCLIFVYKTKTGSPSVMSEDKDVKHLLKYVKPGMKVADLGCGDAGVLVKMIEVGAEAGEGWEIEPMYYLKALKRIKTTKLEKQIKIHFDDMWRAKLERFQLVYVYQLTRYAPKFVKKCLQELKRGSIVVANTYPLKGLRLIKKDHKLFVYKI